MTTRCFKKGVRFLFCLALVGPGGAARAQGLPPQRVKEATFTVVSGVTAERTLRLSGEVRVRVEVVASSPLKVAPEPSKGDANWKIEAGKPTQAVTDAANQVETWRQELVFYPLRPGEHKLPVPGLSYRAGDNKRHVIDWDDPPVLPTLRVLTQIGTADVKDAHDITNIEVVEPEWSAPPWPVFAAAGGGLLLLAAVWWLSRRRRRVVPPSPDRVALGELERLARQEPATAAEVERHQRELAQVVRAYLEQRFQLPAQRRTSAELAAELRQGPCCPTNSSRRWRRFWRAATWRSSRGRRRRRRSVRRPSPGRGRWWSRRRPRARRDRAPP